MRICHKLITICSSRDDYICCIDYIKYIIFYFLPSKLASFEIYKMAGSCCLYDLCGRLKPQIRYKKVRQSPVSSRLWRKMPFLVYIPLYGRLFVVLVGMDRISGTNEMEKKSQCSHSCSFFSPISQLELEAIKVYCSDEKMLYACTYTAQPAGRAEHKSYTTLKGTISSIEP